MQSDPVQSETSDRVGPNTGCLYSVVNEVTGVRHRDSDYGAQAAGLLLRLFDIGELVSNSSLRLPAILARRSILEVGA